MAKAKPAEQLRTDNESAAVDFDDQLSALLDMARERTDQLWPGVVGQLQMAQYQVRQMMHPEDAAAR
ncbi:hypothetical protein [Bradyrhizobium sp. USDA 4350]